MKIPPDLGVGRTVQADGLPVPGRGGVNEEAGGDVSEGVQPDHVVLGEAGLEVEDRDEEDGEDHHDYGVTEDVSPARVLSKLTSVASGPAGER